MTGARVSRRRGVHKVGLTAAAFGLPALIVLPFSTVKASRLQTGTGVSLFDALGTTAALLVGLWVIVIVLSLRDDRRPLPAMLRGLGGSAVIVALLALSEVAAVSLLADAGEFARVSIGSAVWVSVLAAYMLVLASRREVGSRSAAGVVLTVLVPLCVLAMLASGRLDDLSMMVEFENQRERLWTETVNTVVYSGAAMVLASAIGFGLGLLAFRRPRSERTVFGVVSVFQTIPGLAMIGLLFAPLNRLGQSVPLLGSLGVGGLGWAPVVTALTLYALLAITRNTYAGLRGVPTETVEAGTGMGMTEGQVMRRVRLPLAMPVLFSGERTAVVQTIGNSTLGAFVAAFTLGSTIFGGLAQGSNDLMLLGSIVLVALALVADGSLRIVQRIVTPRRSRRREDAT